jgi:hypothetical protein
MADADKKTLEKLRKLHTALRDLQVKADDITEEIGKLLNGEEGIGEKLKGLERDLSEIWAARYGSAYVWQYVRDRPAMKRLLKNLHDDQIVGRWATYLKDNDPFYVKSRHGFGLFASQVNRFTSPDTPQELELLEAPADCKHIPRCLSDQDHTRRRAQENRS